MKNKLTILSLNTENHPAMGKLVQSCQHFKYDLKFYHEGTGFVNFRQTKIDGLLDALSKVDTKYTCYVDAYDTWFLRGDILGKYLYFFGKDLVISGNRNHYPASELYDEFPEAPMIPQFVKKGEKVIGKPSSFRYVNAGQIMGLTKTFLKCVKVMQEQYKGFSDQEGYHYLIAKKLFPITIDYKCRLFLNMTNCTEEDVTDDFVVKETRTKPCSIHFGGPKGGDPNEIRMNNFYNKYLSKLK